MISTWRALLGGALVLVAPAACTSKNGDGLGDSGPYDGHVVPSGGAFCDLPGPAAPFVQVPDGFCARKFADVRAPRSIAFAPNGDVFIASPGLMTPGAAPPGIGGIFVLPDDDHDGIADTNTVFLRTPDLSSIHGLVFTDSLLYYTVSKGVYSLPYASGDRSGQGKNATLVADLSDAGGNDRWTHSLSIGSDGTLYVSRGQYDSSNCAARTPRSGSVLRIGGSHDMHGDAVITGMRNPLYIRCAPWGTCYAAELSGDNWEHLGGVEKLIELKDGDDYGYPCCIDRDKPVDATSNCSAVASSIGAYHLHDTPFGFDWDTNGLWPAPMTNAIFLGFHGSFFAGPFAGTRLGWAPLDPGTHRPTGDVQTLVSGFGHRNPSNGTPALPGRVTDVRMAPDGRLFFTDDEGGAVYWVAPKTLRRP